MIESLLITAGLTGLAASGWYGLPHVFKQRAQRDLQAWCTQTGTLVLTYDDGPGPQLTPALVRLLARYGASATFFPLGQRASERPDLVDLIAQRGHEIGLHTQRHLHTWRCLPGQAARDVVEGAASLRPWTNDRPLFRPPYGKMTVESWFAARRLRCRIAWWTITGGDVEPQLGDPQDVIDETASRNGGVVLLHDFDRPRERNDHADFVLEATQGLLELALRRRWRITTFSGMARESRSDRIAA